MALLQTFRRQLGFAKEVTYGTPVVATDFVPFTSPPKFEDVPVMVKDPGGRGTRAVDQGIYQGTISTTGSFDSFFYPGLGPHFIMGMLGTDSISGPAAKTGTLGVLATTGLTTATYTLVGGAAPLTGETYMIDSGLATEEAVLLSSVSGGGPYTINFTSTPTKYTHLAAAPAASMWTHALTLGNTVPSYCYSDWYNGPNEIQYPGMFYDKVGLKWTSNGDFKVSPSLMGGWPTVTTTQPGAVYTSNLPLMAWQAVLTFNAALTPKLVTFQLDLAQPVAHQYGANGLQSANAGTVGMLAVSGKLGFAVTDDTERNFFRNNTQVATSLVFTSGAKTVTFQMTKTALMPSTAIDTSGTYALLNAGFTAIYNTTDSGPLKFIEVDGRSTAY